MLEKALEQNAAFVCTACTILYSFHGSGASSRSLAGRRGLQLQLSKRRAAPPSVAEDDARHNDEI